MDYCRDLRMAKRLDRYLTRSDEYYHQDGDPRMYIEDSQTICYVLNCEHCNDYGCIHNRNEGY